MEKELIQKIKELEATVAAQNGRIYTLEKNLKDLQIEIQALSSEILYLNQKATSGN